MEIRRTNEKVSRTSLDPRDVEIALLKREVAMLRERQEAAFAEAQDARNHFAELTAVSRRFASSMRGGVGERQQYQRRLAAQYGVSRVLAEARDLDEAAPRIYEVLGERLGWELGVLWKLEEGDGPAVLRRAAAWRSSGSAPGAFEAACEGSCFRHGRGLPGRVWERGETVWVEDFQEEEEERVEAAVEDGLHGTLAFPIVDGAFVGVFELFRREVQPPDEDLRRTAGLVGDQIGQFLERRRAEEERDRALVRERGARERATSILESINDAFFTLDEEQCFTYVNRRAEQFWGMTRENLAGRRIWEVFPESVGSRLNEAVDEVLRDGEATEYEAVSPVIGLWVSGRVYPSPGGVSVLFHSIEGRKRAEEKLRESEERTRLATEAARMLTLELDLSTQKLRYSQNVEGVLGFVPPDTFPGSVALLHEEDRDAALEAYESTVRGEGELDVEYRILHPAGGEPIWVRAQGVLVASPRGSRLLGVLQNVTERKRAEGALRESQERFRAIADLVPDLLWSNDPTGATDWYNRGWFEFTGQNLGESEAYGWLYTVHPEDREGSLAAFFGAVDSAEPSQWEHRIRGRNGSYRWFLLKVRPLHDDEGRVVRWFGAATDIHEQRVALEALGRSENRYRSLAEATSSIVWTGARDGAVVEEIPDWQGFTGQTYDEYRGFGWLEALHPEDRPPQSLWEELLASDPEPMLEEYRLRRRDGEYRRILLRAVPILDEGGETREWIGTVSDVEDRRRAEEEREELRREAERERARLQTILQQMPGGVFVAEQSGGLFTANEGGTRIYGRPIRTVAECAAALLSYPDGEKLEQEHTALSRALRGEAVSGMEVYVIRPDGTRRVIRSNAAPIRDGEGNVVAAVKVFEDVTGRKRAERERDNLRESEREAHEAVEEAERRLAFFEGAREERQIISRELHDRVAHSMAVVGQNLELYEVFRERAPEAAAAKLDLAKQEAKASLKATRDLSMMLRRSEVEGGLRKALEGLRETTVPDGISYEFSSTGEDHKVPPHVGNQVFLILREAVRNAVNHSGCGRVAVKLETTEEGVVGMVEDDGRGFEPDGARRGGGLRSMEERAALVGGSFKLSHVPWGGVRIKVSAPLSEAVSNGVQR